MSEPPRPARPAWLRRLRAALLGGAAAGLLAPVALGAILVLNPADPSALAPTVGERLSVVFIFAFTTALGAAWGLAGGLVIGFPALTLLDRFGLLHPLAGALLGACVGPILTPPFPALGASIGAACGALSAFLARREPPP